MSLSRNRLHFTEKTRLPNKKTQKKKSLESRLYRGERRLDFCQRFQGDNFNDASISDENCFQFTSNHLKILSRENVGVKISKFSTKTPLCIIDGTLNSAQYCKILNGFLETAHVLYPEGGRIVQDTSTYSTAWMPEQSLVTIPLGAGNGIVTRL